MLDHINKLFISSVFLIIVVTWLGYIMDIFILFYQVAPRLLG